MRRPVWAIGMAFLLALPVLPALGEDAELAKGIRQVQEEDYTAAIVILDGVVQHLSKSPGAAPIVPEEDAGEGHVREPENACRPVAIS